MDGADGERGEQPQGEDPDEGQPSGEADPGELGDQEQARDKNDHQAEDGAQGHRHDPAGEVADHAVWYRLGPQQRPVLTFDRQRSRGTLKSANGHHHAEYAR